MRDSVWPDQLAGTLRLLVGSIRQTAHLHTSVTPLTQSSSLTSSVMTGALTKQKREQDDRGVAAIWCRSLFQRCSWTQCRFVPSPTPISKRFKQKLVQTSKSKRFTSLQNSTMHRFWDHFLSYPLSDLNVPLLESTCLSNLFEQRGWPKPWITIKSPRS